MNNKQPYRLYANFIPDPSYSPERLQSEKISPILKSSPNFKVKAHYKSPQSTPTSSPIPMSRPSVEAIFQSLSDKKLTNATSTLKLTQKLLIKDKRIKALEEENKRLNDSKNSSRWEKELNKRNNDIREREEQISKYKRILSKIDDEKLLVTIEKQEKRIKELEELVSRVQKEKNIEYEAIIREIKADNFRLISELDKHSQCVKKEEHVIALRKVSVLENSLESSIKESQALNNELDKFRKELPTGSLVYFSSDVFKIRKEVAKLLKIFQELQQGKEVTLKGLLGLESEKKIDPSLQLCNDIQGIKTDLNTIFQMVSDFHADQWSIIGCKPQ